MVTEEVLTDDGKREGKAVGENDLSAVTIVRVMVGENVARTVATVRVIETVGQRDTVRVIETVGQ